MSRSAVIPNRLAGLVTDPHVFDVLVVGGGIVGSGVARDAAMRGMRVALVEQNDFASGTSSRSSRLLHGGLRYLAQGRIGLVREASLEKRVVQVIAPHLSAPLPFVFPTYRGGDWQRWKLAIGVKLYDLLCNGRNFGRSGSLNQRRVIEMLPGLQRKGLTGAVRYYDGFTNDARLVIDTLRSAKKHGAELYNYAKLEDATRPHDVWSCRIRDNVDGQCVTVQARTVVNASGPWAARFAHSRVRLRLTKGVHLVIDHQRLPLDEAVVMTQGKRILFAIPWGKRIILGTTDTDYDGPIESPRCNEEDISYVLGVTNNAFPGANLVHADVNSQWAGLRPLIAGDDDDGKPSDISRSHRITMSEPGWFDVAGGKLTTYRLMAEQAVDQIRRHMGIEHKPSETAVHPLIAPEETMGSGLLPPAVSYEQVEHYCRHEWAAHLDDVMVRRSGWAYYHEDVASTMATVARWMADLLGWDRLTIAAEMQRFEVASGLHVTQPTTSALSRTTLPPCDDTLAMDSSRTQAG